MWTSTSGRTTLFFSQLPDETYVAAEPPFVARAEGGERETWIPGELKRLTVDTASGLHKNGRNYLRSKGHGYVHRQLKFRLSDRDAIAWRRSLMLALRDTPPRNDTQDKRDNRHEPRSQTGDRGVAAEGAGRTRRA